MQKYDFLKKKYFYGFSAGFGKTCLSCNATIHEGIMKNMNIIRLMFSQNNWIISLPFFRGFFFWTKDKWTCLLQNPVDLRATQSKSTKKCIFTVDPNPKPNFSTSFKVTGLSVGRILCSVAYESVFPHPYPECMLHVQSWGTALIHLDVNKKIQDYIFWLRWRLPGYGFVAVVCFRLKKYQTNWAEWKMCTTVWLLP